jgi:short-subunit dehydrogenase
MDSTQPEHDKRVMSAEVVVLITLKALDKNRAIIIPGWRNRLQAMAPRLAPRWLVRKVAARINRTPSRS